MIFFLGKVKVSWLMVVLCRLDKWDMIGIDVILFVYLLNII